MMRPLLTDVLIGAGLALLCVVLLMLASFNSTFIYRGF
jgi:hypothetical protein